MKEGVKVNDVIERLTYLCHTPYMRYSHVRILVDDKLGLDPIKKSKINQSMKPKKSRDFFQLL